MSTIQADLSCTPLFHDALHAFQKKGVEGLLYIETFRRGVKKGYPQAECSWILESNTLMQRGLERMGGRRYKTYRIYEAPL